MTEKTIKLSRLLIAVLIGVIVFLALWIDNVFLALAGVVGGVFLLLLIRKQYKRMLVDERVESIAGQAGYMTFMITTIMLALFALLMITGARHIGLFVESLGIVFGYLAILNIVIYTIVYHYFNNSGGQDEK